MTQDFNSQLEMARLRKLIAQNYSRPDPYFSGIYPSFYEVIYDLKEQDYQIISADEADPPFHFGDRDGYLSE